MYRSISTLLFGSEDHHLEVRVRVALELINNWDDYLYGNRLQQMSTHKVDGLVESVALMSLLEYGTDMEQSLKLEIRRTLVKKKHSAPCCIYMPLPMPQAAK
jgi:hypothetical protein